MARKWVHLADENFKGYIAPLNDTEAFELAKTMYRVIKARRQKHQHPLVTGSGKSDSVGRAFKLRF